jgi:ferric-dicitrate binding protein FerR (iron transport regulator)
MKTEIPWLLLKKSLSNTLSPGEQRDLEQWIEKSELNKHIFDEVSEDKLFQEAILSSKWDDNSATWNQILSRIQQPTKRISMSRRQFLIMSAAAILLLLVTISSLFYVNDRLSNPGNEIPEGYTYIFSPRGQRTKVILPDRSRIWLNSESSLRYSTVFNATYREVVLQGEAFFEIQPDPAKPFFVSANEINVKVYGTSFNIRAFPNENTIETTLIEGKLSVISLTQSGGEPNEVFLRPNEKCIVTRDTKNVEISASNQTSADPSEAINYRNRARVVALKVQKGINTEEEKLWKDGKLVFRDRPFAKLAVDLERWFDVKIHFEDKKIGSYKFTGVFDKETINQALEALKLSSPKSFQYEISYRDIYLTSK